MILTYKTNILLLYYTMLSILEYSIFFSVSYNYITYDYNLYDYFVNYVTITHNIILHPLSRKENK